MSGKAIVGCALVALLSGCGDDDGAGTDAGGGGIDAGLVDAGPPRDSGMTDAPFTPVPDGGAVDAAARAIWRPAPGTSWQWQLSGTIDTTVDAVMYDVDLFETPAALVRVLHGGGRIVVCYFSAGTIEEGRPDFADFPAGAIGMTLPDWPMERWLDTRDATVRDIMRRRLDLAVTRGCDGVEPDNVDAYANASGFPLTADDQLDFNRFIATEAHARGLSVGLKNDLDQVATLVGDFDWALDEECFQYTECDLLQPFIDAGKAVFQVEYGDAALAATVCPQANALDFDTLIKNVDLDAWRIACR